ncbi:MAG: 7-cyano-7-deazaguanine synthase, partial [Candidatus Bipolaricaulota bacterium]
MGQPVLVCLSGGVDSAVAAYVLQRAGYEVAAVTFLFSTSPQVSAAAGETHVSQFRSAVRAAAELGIPHEVLDAREAFHERVVQDFLEQYRRGTTPNPCGRCNRLLRFELAFAAARVRGIDLVSTGHHARVAHRDDGSFELLRGVDRRKDQSYFLYGLG